MLVELDELGDEESMLQTDKIELQNTLHTLSSKVEDLSTCNDLIGKHGTARQRSLSEVETLRLPAQSNEKIKLVNKYATLFCIMSNAMINACRDLLTHLGKGTSEESKDSLESDVLVTSPL